MPREGFEPTISMFEVFKITRTSDFVATGTGSYTVTVCLK